MSSDEDNDYWSDEDDPYPEFDDEEPGSPVPEWNRQPTPPRQPPQGRRNTRIFVCRWRGLIVVTYTDLGGEVVVVDLTGEESEREHSPGVPAVVPVPAVQVLTSFLFNAYRR